MMHLIRLSPIGLSLLCLVGCDQGTKFWAKSTLQYGPGVSLIPNVFDLRYVENYDIAFNILRWIPEQVRYLMLITFGAIACLAIIVVLYRTNRFSYVERFGLVCIAAGAWGNYIDRVCRGYVVDFLYIHYWPVFNVADILISGGVIMVLIFMRRTNWANEMG